ncbi:hypothetical protein K2173_003364 [Erythroxylum novogranatense]|uniref:RAVE complex protein Rav1 C-terminal domain-containing protein n=1 Tax=Erythroxylum novogranatense TaxID=1862640 RepID=A0AAV8S8H8_9ROSI|nr:hypothetical protein K2173_003364 [Erythroxylum novogranatense]
MPETKSVSAVDPVDHLPLTFLGSDVIPPAPTRSSTTVDWLPDFRSYSWVAYGASSVLVISHLPSPLSSGEILIGPILRQVFQLSANPSLPVSAVSWSPVTPSEGELAAAVDNRIYLFCYSDVEGSFSWSQNALLVQSTKVEAIKWSGSGDGIIAGGIDVVLWRKKNRSWEIAWKFKRDEPQNLVSATLSIAGLSATAAYSNELHCIGSSNASKSVLVCYSDEISEFVKTELVHPMPVSMIQWRPSTERKSQQDVNFLTRHVLLTCCLDGSVRLWTEVDNGKVRKLGKENSGFKAMSWSFCVAAVVEINQTLNGTLGKDVFFNWPTEIGGIGSTGEDSHDFLRQENELDKVGRCEWLIAFGPGTLISFWVVHCLDDISPMRFPRVSLWRRQELQDLEAGNFKKANLSNCKDWLLLNKATILRNHLSGPPSICSLIHLLPCNSFFWSMFHIKTHRNAAVSNLKHYFSCSISDVSSIGHTGKILQIVMHPQINEIGFAASLDSNGLLLFWLFSPLSSCNLHLPTMAPSWQICGKLVTHNFCSLYTSLEWAPSTLGKEHILLLGHQGGVDCFIVDVSQIQEKDVICEFLCTIPVTGHGPYEGGPTNIFAIPLPSTCKNSFKFNKFLLLGVWIKGFRALSWEVTVHSFDLSERCCICNFDDTSQSTSFLWRFEKKKSYRIYCIGVNPSSSQLPEPHSHNQITTFSVVCPGNLIPKEESLGFHKDTCSCVPAYIMATGSCDGSLKLWKSNSSNHRTPYIPWELVGEFVAHHGPISAICLTDSGHKIATICKESHVEETSIMHIYDLVNIMGAGSFVLEDSLPINGDVLSLRWLALGNGQLVLGVCLQNELRIYAQKCSNAQIFLNHGKTPNLHFWSCIAIKQTVPAFCDFVWGPQATAVVVHDRYFSVLGQWLFLGDAKQQAKIHNKLVMAVSEVAEDKDMPSSILTDHGIVVGDSKESLIDKFPAGSSSASPLESKVVKIWPTSSLHISMPQQNHCSSAMYQCWSILELANKLKETLPVYHPKALLVNIYSGNWKRAYMSIRHLVDCLSDTNISERRCGSGKHSQIIPSILLSNYFEGLLLKDSTYKEFKWNADERSPALFSQFALYSSTSNSSSSMSSYSSITSELVGFVEPVEKLYNLAALTNLDKLQLLAIIDLLGEVQHSASAYENLDECGRRFWVLLRFEQLCFYRSFGKSASIEELNVDSMPMSLAFHSDCQETLLNSFLSTDPSWNDMRALGVGFWFTNVSQLRTRMEKLARTQYLRKKDPKDCALLYIALNRLQVLAGLFKISKDEKDKPLVAFLVRNFQEEKNKAAALKNAYVLMGRHQLELAIAFFLLGGDTYSAVTVCVKNLGDQQLALVICRLVEGRGGPLEQYLITKFILPSTTERGDYWLTSMLQWELGNYCQSFLSMLGFSASSGIDKSVQSSNHVAFVDPLVGLYCLSLVNKNSLKNAIGEQSAAILGRWATFMSATAFNRCGLPLEALECLSSPLTITGAMDQGTGSSGDHHKHLPQVLRPSTSNISNWLSGDVAMHLDSHAKLELAVQYFSKVAMEHPDWPDNMGYVQHSSCSHGRTLKEEFQQKFFMGLSKFEQKFTMFWSCIIKMIFVWLWNKGSWFIGYDILLDYTSQNQAQETSYTVGKPAFYPVLSNLLLKDIQDTSLLLSRYLISCCLINFHPKSYSVEDGTSMELRSTWSYASQFYLPGFVSMLWNLRAAMSTFSCIFSEDIFSRTLAVLDLFEYYVHFASAWLQHDPKVLLLMVQPLIISCGTGHTQYEIDIVNLKNIIHQAAELLTCDLSIGNFLDSKVISEKPSGLGLHSLPDDEKQVIIGACLWQHMFRFMKHKLHLLSIKLEDIRSPEVPRGEFSSYLSSPMNFGCGSNKTTEQIEYPFMVMARILNNTLAHISSHHVRLLGSLLQQKVEKGLHISTFVWLKESNMSPLHQEEAGRTSHQDEFSNFDRLWNICADPNLISEALAQEKINWPRFVNIKSSKGWIDMFKGMTEDLKADDGHRICSSPYSEEAGSSARSLFRNGPAFLSSWQKDAITKNEVSCFHSFKEIYKRDGELLEALCINSTKECQIALASNRKGLIFFSWGDAASSGDQSDYVWSTNDWPPNGWAGTESTPVPTCVSPGVGLGIKKGSHLGLGGATIGVGYLTRPRKDLTGGAFGIPGYTGIGASGLGWEVQEDFEETVDPPATVANISTRALSSHPLKPFFLVGSSNTHIYLWEFGKEKATATYGVLPAANVPPPYALASISALQFDRCGHRFVSAASDGTVCTWQLEVGGRSNIYPTESSLCFNGYASDVTYVAASGSVIAAAGYNSNGINAVIWDTLAPPTTSQANIFCHEGGARSISVFDNDIGSGSISPLIVTGGKGGDVGLHDFRYIATGKTKRYRNFGNSDGGSSSSSGEPDTKKGSGNKSADQNTNGMLWYIPKAHSGSVTKISTIPHTSLFLTGSKDGDVKLWDAKAAKLIYHWPKLHDRRIFLQPSSRGFGGVVRAAVTDIQVVSRGFLTCGGDGSVKLIRFKDCHHGT